MKIWIDEAGDGASPVVSFSSPAGHATAVWRGRTPPHPGEHDVELEVADPLRWGRDLREYRGPAAAIEQTEGGYRLRGRAVRLDDGVLAVDVGGGILMLDTEGDPPAEVAGRMLEFDSPVLELYPTGI